MRSYPVRVACICAIGLTLAGCQLFRGVSGGGGAPPVAKVQSWREAATQADHDRLRRARAAWTKAIGQARTAGHSADLAALGAMIDPDLALEGVAPPPGRYRCRTVKIGAKSPGMLDYVAYPAFDCVILADASGRLRFEKTGGSQRPKGMLWADDHRRMIFLGTMELGDEQAPMAYGSDRARDLAGILEKVGPARWRLALPWPHWESNLDLIELVPSNQP